MPKPDGDSSTYATIVVSGADAAPFLQGQLTLDVQSLTEGDPPALSAWCNPKGRVIVLFRMRLADGAYRLALPGEQVITQGEKGDCMYFISSGAARVQLEPEPVILGSGDFFGEMALLESVPRKVSVISEGFCDLLILATRDFNTLLDAHPTLRATIEQVARERSG